MSVSGNIGVHGGDSGDHGTPIGLDATATLKPLDVSLGFKDARFEIGGALKPTGDAQPLIIDLNEIHLTGDPKAPVTVNAGLTGAKDKPIAFSITGDADAPVTVNAGLGLTGAKDKPITVDATIAAGLDNIGVTVKGDPKNPVTIDLGLDNIHACLALAFTEIPSVRVEMPTSSCVGLSILGIPIFNFSFEGRWGLTTEDNPPRIFQGRPPFEHDLHDEAAGFRNMPHVSVSLDPEP